MSDLKLETLSADDLRTLLKERDHLRAEVAKLTATLNRSSAGVELLKEATCLALDYLVAPNPYADLTRQRMRAIRHMEDALTVNGCGVARFDVRSDAN